MGNMNELPVAIIGAGPVGLAAAAHLLERGEEPIIFEAGANIGNNVLAWGHVRMFSPWEFNMDAACVRLLEATEWVAPPLDKLPTGTELYRRYLRPLAELPALREKVHTGARVKAISRRNIDKMKDAGRESAAFQLQVSYDDGSEALIEAWAVIDASGTWHNPNPLGANGLSALGEARLQQRISYGIPDIKLGERERFADKRVLVVGSGHSAINALLDLVRLKAKRPNTLIVWAMRSANLQKVYGGGDGDALKARGQLGSTMRQAVTAGAVEMVAPFQIMRIEENADVLQVSGDLDGMPYRLSADEVIVCTGARPELDMLGELRLDLDPAVESSRALAPLIDPNQHNCGTVRPHGEAELRQPEPNFYIVGMKSYGRAPTFLLATGYEQVRSVVASMAGDWQAARDVQLNLPETGVCNSDFAGEAECCAVTTDDSALALLSIDEIPVVASCCDPQLIMPS